MTGVQTCALPIYRTARQRGSADQRQVCDIHGAELSSSRGRGSRVTSFVWSLPRRVAFRFAFLAAALLVWPFPFGVLPKTDPIADALNAPWNWFVVWTAEHVLNIPAPSMDSGGGSDSTWRWIQLLVTVALALAGTAVWSIADRRRTAYPRLAAALEIVMRYWFAFTMLRYGFGKVFRIQFTFPHVFALHERVGDMSPMGLLWAFMGYSGPYTVFAGVLESLGAVLLLWRTTRVLGALVLATVLTNVAMLDLCYDVPVKLFSLELLVVALALLVPHARRLLAAATGHAVTELPARPRGSTRAERARRAAKLAMLGAFALVLYDDRADYAGFFAEATQIDGAWQVDRFVAGGVERPPLATDAARWNEVLVAGGAKLGPVLRIAVLPLAGAPDLRGAMLDASAHTIYLENERVHETWRYTLVDADHLELDAPGIHATLHREPAGLLETRGFHWVQERPLNR